MVILICQSVTECFPLFVKNGKNDKNDKNNNVLLYICFHELCNDGSYFFNRRS